MAQGLFLGGSGQRAGAHTRPAFPKMPTAPSAFPLFRAPQTPGDEPPTKGVKAWGKGPLRPKEIFRYRDTLGQIRAADNTAGRSATQYLERCRTRLICGIWWPPHPTGMWHKDFFLWWVRAQGRSPHAPGISKNAYGPVCTHLIRGASGAGRWTQPPPRA